MASITCKVGGTAHTHTSVAAVRECSSNDRTLAQELNDDRKVAEKDFDALALLPTRPAVIKPVAKPSERTGASARVTEADVPEGRYALDGSGANATVFYIVKWWDGRNGRMFSVYHQVTDSETRVDFKVALGVLRRIADVTAHAASIRYGRELGVCGVCGRTLTNDASREAGIGPVCAGKF